MFFRRPEIVFRIQLIISTRMATAQTKLIILLSPKARNPHRFKNIIIFSCSKIWYFYSDTLVFLHQTVTFLSKINYCFSSTQSFFWTYCLYFKLHTCITNVKFLTCISAFPQLVEGYISIKHIVVFIFPFLYLITTI